VSSAALARARALVDNAGHGEPQVSGRAYTAMPMWREVGIDNSAAHKHGRLLDAEMACRGLSGADGGRQAQLGLPKPRQAASTALRHRRAPGGEGR